MKPASLLARLRRPGGRRFVAFLLTGGLAALVNILSRIGFEWLLRHEDIGPATAYGGAVILAYLVGMTTAFTLARAFVFAGSGRAIHVEYGRFALVNVAALAQVWIVSMLLARLVFPAIGLTWNAETIAHVIGVFEPRRGQLPRTQAILVRLTGRSDVLSEPAAGSTGDGFARLRRGRAPPAGARPATAHPTPRGRRTRAAPSRPNPDTPLPP